MRTSLIKDICVIGLVLLLATLLAVGSGAAADPATDPDVAPTLLTYQGRVTDPATGDPVPDGDYNFVFRLFSVQSGGTALWTETQTIYVSDGFFNALLGSVTPLSASLFSGTDRWLEVQVGGQTLSPRFRFSSAAYALQAQEATNADTLDGSHASAFALSSHNHDASAITSGTLSSDRYTAYGDLSVEGYLDNNADNDLLTRTQADGRYINVGEPVSNADTVDGFHASASPAANQLIALDGSAYLKVPRMVDSNSNSYYVDPAGNSVMSDLELDSLTVEFILAQGSLVYLTGGLEGDYFGAGGTDSSCGFYSTGKPVGVCGTNASDTGVYGRGVVLGGQFEDSNSGTYAYLAYGSYGIMSNGTKSFIQQHPTDPSKAIVYAALEGGEAGTYYRGSGQLSGGMAVIQLPEHFGLVTEEDSLTAQVTPRDDCKGLYIVEVTTDRIVVRELQGGASNARFDFFINGVRSGYDDFQVILDAANVTPPGLDTTHGQAPGN